MNTQMRGSVPEASGEASGPEGGDSNMGTVPTSGPEATSSQGKPDYLKTHAERKAEELERGKWMRSLALQLDVKCVICGHKWSVDPMPDMPMCPKCMGPVTVLKAKGRT